MSTKCAFYVIIVKYYLLFSIKDTDDCIAVASGRKCVICICPCVNQSSGKYEDLLSKSENKLLIEFGLTELLGVLI